MNWVIALAVVLVLLVAGCAVVLRSASDSASEAIDFAKRSVCYDTGWQDGRAGTEQGAPFDQSECASLYSDGFADAEADRYEPPEE
ncbi:MAG: hypothetical protein HYS09_00685 [Chloroflexi bacterium]|nr:hypothetical protein [Chloroflexota bacterium]